MENQEILSIEKCGCGRPFCGFFGAGVGDSGASFTKDQLNQALLDKIEDHKNCERAINHLKELLK